MRTASVPSGTPGCVEESLLFPRPGGGLLAGTLALPESGITGASVLLLHGWGGTRSGPHRLLVRIARDLAARGRPALRFDLSGRGESDGDAATADLDALIADALAGRRLLAERFPALPIAACGLCSGGNLALGAATLEPFARLALLSTLPFQPPAAAMRRKRLARLLLYARKALRPSTWLRLLRGEIDPGGVARGLAADEGAAARRLRRSARDIPAALARLRAPCLFLWGALDPEAAPAEICFRELAERHAIPAVFEPLAGANHNFQEGDAPERVAARAVGFLTEEG